MERSGESNKFLENEGGSKLNLDFQNGIIANIENRIKKSNKKTQDKITQLAPLYNFEFTPVLFLNH